MRYRNLAKILLAEDDVAVAASIIEAMKLANNIVEWVEDGTETFFRLRTFDYDLAILDWGLPGMTGVEICQAHRAAGKTTPILMLTGRSSLDEKESGFNAGADDYLTKPFELRELLVRIKALLRRSTVHSTDMITIRGVTLDVAAGKVSNGQGFVQLIPTELALLEFLMRHKNTVYSVDTLLSRVWDNDLEISEDAVRQCITRVRRKVDLPGGRSLINTVKGLGYVIED